MHTCVFKYTSLSSLSKMATGFKGQYAILSIPSSILPPSLLFHSTTFPSLPFSSILPPSLLVPLPFYHLPFSSILPPSLLFPSLPFYHLPFSSLFPSTTFPSLPFSSPLFPSLPFSPQPLVSKRHGKSSPSVEYV